MILGQEKPSLVELGLQHFGVLGMKWGRSRAKGTSAQVRQARRDLTVKRNAFRSQEDKKDSLPAGSAARAKAQAQLERMKKDFNSDPARVLASRTTRGEKVAALIIAGPFGLIPIAAASAVSRRIERKQDLGKA